MSNTKFKVGDRVRWVGEGQQDTGVVRTTKPMKIEWDTLGEGYWPLIWNDQWVEQIEENDPVSPNHYRFPGGAEVIQISEHLTSNGGQAVQYVARATRLDGQIKGNAIEDLEKAAFFIQREIDRLKESK